MDTSVLRESQVRGPAVGCVSDECRAPARLRLSVVSLPAPLVLLLCCPAWWNSDATGMASMASSACVGSSLGGRGSALACGADESS